MRMWEAFSKLELSSWGIKGGGGCYEEKCISRTYTQYTEDNKLTSHFLNAALSSGIVCTGTPTISPTILSGAAISKVGDCNEI